ncbi:hypothetical protein K439DRAFT_462900 [Ramaria rubella]|nr:hypothetical protein K439DRAFT_462900 [Ramaria rubella]
MQSTTSFARLQQEGSCLRDEDVQGAYLDHKNCLVNAIDCTKSILNDVREFNKNSWIVRYPQMQPNDRLIDRSVSFADDAATMDVVNKPTSQDQLSDFLVLRLDLNLGPHGSSTGPAPLVSQLEKSSIATLLDERIGASMKHIDKLRFRIEDTSSKVLVTGDLNAGKSTFVNALLRRPVMPVDQQPCTSLFCEVHDAAENNGVEELHIIKDGAAYDIKDYATYTRASLSELESICGENENVQQVVRLFVADARRPTESLLHNGVVDIALIDAPGLNRDSLKTTALFARQEEIDIVVFVVSAENHFTLSAKEFLRNASNEKAYLFIVVNRFDQIRDKEKCKRLVLEQIKQLSPRTYDNAKDLIHFVDSSSSQLPASTNATFDDLESSLRSFVLVKRAKSKLHPASTYLCHLLSDVDLLASTNAVVAQTELDQAQDNLNKARPVLEMMKQGREIFEDNLEAVEEGGATEAGRRTREVLDAALENVGHGEPGVDNAITMPTYPGLFGFWEYTRDVRKALLTSLDMAVSLAQNDARATTCKSIKHIAALGEAHLPEGVERSKRVFMPERMFSPKTSGRLSTGRSTVVAGGFHGLGIGLAQRSDLLEVTFFDVLDVRHHFSAHFGDGNFSHHSGKTDTEDDSQATALSIVSVGVGALTMVGGKTLGARGIIEGIVRIADFFGNETARKWAAPVIGVFTISLAAYFILELPTSIPRTVGRRIRASLVRPTEGISEETMFVNSHAIRVTRETRKVLRLASWDLKERFRAAMDEREKEVKGAEEQEKKAAKAFEWFTDVKRRTGEARAIAGLSSS